MKTRLSVAEAAKMMQVSEQFPRVSMQQGKLPFGYVLKTSSQYTYYINSSKFEEYTGIKLAERT